MTTNYRDLERRITEWGRRRPATPAATAARRVVAKLAARSAPRLWPRRAAVATAASLAGLGLWFILAQPPQVTPLPAAIEAPEPLPANVIQFWLDPDTPVYFVTGPLEPVERGLP